jgi:hypothetical protein
MTQPVEGAPVDGVHGAGMTLKNGVLLTLLIVFGIGAWIALGGMALGIKSFFASFLFAWYWSNLGGADFKRIPECLIGALVGVALTWQLKLAPEAAHLLGISPATASIISLLIVVAALFVQVMNWVPMAVNSGAMLFLTVLAAPALLTSVDFVEITKAIVGGALFFAALAYVAKLYVEARTRAKPAAATA